MVLVARLSGSKNHAKSGSAASHQKKKVSSKLRRVISRRVSVVVNATTRPIETPTDVHPRNIRFSSKLVSKVYEIAPRIKCSGLHYTESELARMAEEMRQEAVLIRTTIEADGTFQEKQDLTIEGLEELVFPQKTEERRRCATLHTRRVVQSLRNDAAVPDSPLPSNKISSAAA